MRFDLVDLRLFLHIADAHSITHGARRANLALASGSERIRGMEKLLGVALLIRDRRGVSFHLLANVSWSTRVSSFSKRSACEVISPATRGDFPAPSAC
jgi:Bacterial regulatory helix-turn-helix protein, lysR family